MILKRVTMIGFKSFADKTEVAFNHGVTAVVGPNGCGKSNVVDAIRWVLGEQRSKVLRGGKMEDVIFNGCDSRKASGLSEVSLTFDNSDGQLPVDFSEVTVTRRLFRSGESQYLINKSQCRLKDIQELFMDTGVGTSSYSIIEQGQMDRIINARPSDRREIFEEAAGITKYKVKRREAERRLLHTEDNLTRLNDILIELKRQIQSLTRQADKARRYKKLREELLLVDSQYTLKRFEDLRQKISDDKENLKENEAALHKEKDLLENGEGLFHDKLERIKYLDQKNQEERENKYSIESEIDRFRQANQFKKERIEDIQRRIEEEKSGRQQNESKLQELRSLKDSWVEKEQHTQGELAEKDQECNAYIQNIDKVASLLEEKKNEVFKAKEELERIKLSSSLAQTKIVESQTQEQNLVELMDKNEEEIDGLKLSLTYEDEQYDRLEQILSDVNTQKEEASDSLVQKEKRHREDKEQLDGLENLMIKVSSELSEKNSRKEALENLKNSYEGFFAGVRAVLLKKNEGHEDFSGILGTVSDIIRTDSKYEVAVEVALGSRIQNVVVDRGEDAKIAVEFLKRNRLGRVTFLPLDLSRGRGESRSFRNDPRIIGRLLDFIEYEPQYNDLMKNLLDQYLVVHNLSDGIRLMREGLKGFNLVTLEGELLSGTGAITGGDTKAAVKGFLSRENEIEELSQEVQRLQNRLIQENERRNRLKESTQVLLADIDESKTRLGQIQVEFNEAQRDLHRSQVERDNLRKRLDFLYSELQKVSEKRSSLSENLSDLEGSLEETAESEKAVKAQIFEMESHLESLMGETSTDREKLAGKRAEYKALEEKLCATQSRVKEIDIEINDRLDWMRNFETNQSQRVSQIKDLEVNISSNETRLTEMLEKLEGIDENILRNEQDLLKLREELDQFENDRKKSQRELEELHEKNSELRVRIAEMEGKVENLREHLFSKYQMRLEEVEKVEDEALGRSWDEIPERIETLDRRIKNLGSVNLAAIEELETLEKRHEFLDKQEKDLKVARGQLEEVIEKINTKATEMFNDTFNRVKVYFRDMFTELFGGGKAELKMIEGEDISLLDAGIEIVARPPGKQPQTISLLSGGEKALTAVALLFALFKVKPSPFCVLDELDAPLDDVNISRFTKVLKTFAKGTQFIIITHNKTTLKIADLLYGVTQEVRGISRVVSMKFVDDDLETLLEESTETGPVKIRHISIKEDDELKEYTIPDVKPIRLELEPKEPEERQSIPVGHDEVKSGLEETVPLPQSDLRRGMSFDEGGSERVVPQVNERSFDLGDSMKDSSNDSEEDEGEKEVISSVLGEAGEDLE